MRRITLTLVSTLAVLVLLFSYKTSRNVPISAAQVNGTVGVAAGSVVSAGSSSATAAGSADPPTPSTLVATAQSITVPTTATTSSTRRTTAAASSAPSSSAKTTTSTTKVATSAPTTTAAAAPEVVNGGAADTRYGPVQVQITVLNGKITAVTAVEYPQENPRDAEINSQAIPELQAQALAAQNAQIDGVGGATYTTQGFEQSLQSAIDAAHLS